MQIIYIKVMWYGYTARAHIEYVCVPCVDSSLCYMEALCVSGFGAGQNKAGVGLLGALVILEKPQNFIV